MYIHIMYQTFGYNVVCPDKSYTKYKFDIDIRMDNGEFTYNI